VQAPAPELALAAAAIAELLGLSAPATAATAGESRAAMPDPFTTAGRWRATGLD
jgi:hypothetical protein